MYFWMILVYCLSMTLGSRVKYLNIYFPQFQLYLTLQILKFKGNVWCNNRLPPIKTLKKAAEVYIPIFYRLGIRSTYEYLELRFKLVFNFISLWKSTVHSKKTVHFHGHLGPLKLTDLNTLIKSRSLRSITMGLFLIAGIITTGIAIYAPATALSAVTSMNLDIAILSTGIVLVFSKFPHDRLIWRSFALDRRIYRYDRTKSFSKTISSLYILHINRRNESCRMDRCNSIKLDDCRKVHQFFDL